MRRQHISRTSRSPRAALSTIAALCLVAACGGGGGGGGGIAPATTITLSGNVTSSVGAPLPGALVSLGGVPTTSDSRGDYQLTLDTAVVNTGTIVVVTVSKDGYQSCTGIVNTTVGSVAGCGTLTPVSTGELYPAAADAALVRLGDGEVTGGQANSALQLNAAYGLSKTVTLPWPTNLTTIANYQNFAVNLRIRGLQASLCADRITVLQGATAGTAAPLKVFQYSDGSLLDSDASGAFSSYALQVPVASLSASAGDVHVKLEAGDCGANGTPSDPADDFEFVDLHANFT